MWPTPCSQLDAALILPFNYLESVGASALTCQTCAPQVILLSRFPTPRLALYQWWSYLKTHLATVTNSGNGTAPEWFISTSSILTSYIFWIPKRKMRTKKFGWRPCPSVWLFLISIMNYSRLTNQCIFLVPMMSNVNIVRHLPTLISRRNMTTWLPTRISKNRSLTPGS